MDWATVSSGTKVQRTSPIDPTHTERLNLEALEAIRGGSKGPNFSPPQRSLLREILSWMLAPLFLLWPMCMAIIYVVAQNIANVPYDHALANNLQVLARQVSIEDGRAVLSP